MAEQIINGAPLLISRGTQDNSVPPLVRLPEAIPSHLPKFFVYAEKGPTEPRLVVGASRITTYGARTWDLTDKYANHATVFANGANEMGNQCMIQRVIPTDAGPLANAFVSVDVMAGATAADPLKLALHVKYAETQADLDNWYTKRETNAGDNVSDWSIEYTPGSPVVATRYPLFDCKASSIGAALNLTGLRMYARNDKDTSGMDKSVLNEGYYPFDLTMIRKNAKTNTSLGVDNNYGERNMSFVLAPGVTHPGIAKTTLDLEEIIPAAYESKLDPRLPPKDCDIGEVYMYYNDIAALLTTLATKEIPTSDPADVITGAHEDDFVPTDVAANAKFKYNLFGLQNSSGTAYNTAAFVTTLPTATPGGGTYFVPGKNTDIMLGGASDGTMDDYQFSLLVEEQMLEYVNRDSRLMNDAIHVESVIYDSGFPASTKKALCNFIAIRRDTMVMLAPYSTIVVGSTIDPVTQLPAISPGGVLKASEDSSACLALNEFVNAFPESDYFGTPVARGVIMGRSGKIRNSQWKQEVPVLYSVMKKNCAYMGASNGKWIPGKGVDGAPNSIVDDMYAISEAFTPASVRITDWDLGLNWVQDFDRSSIFIPALQTVYREDRSVLNNMYTMFVIAELNKVMGRAWRQFSGVGNKMNGPFAKSVDDFITDRAHPSRFDNRFIIEPRTYFTDADVSNGFSWTTPVHLYANPMRTVMVSSIHSHRMSDYGLEAEAA